MDTATFSSDNSTVTPPVEAPVYSDEVYRRIRSQKSTYAHPLRHRLGVLARYAFAFVGIFLLILVVLNGPSYYKKAQYWYFSNFVQPKNENASFISHLPELPLIGKGDLGRPEVQAVAEAMAAAEEPIPERDEIWIPDIGVRAPIIFAQSADEKSIQNDLRNGVVHYPGTAKPGEIGNVFITGHSSNYWWDSGKYKTVFALLDRLNVGQTVTVYHNRVRYVYKITSRFEVNPRQIEVMAPTDTPVLTLMTCTPVGTDWRRLIVRAEQIEPSATQNVIPVDPPRLPEIKMLPAF